MSGARSGLPADVPSDLPRSVRSNNAAPVWRRGWPAVLLTIAAIWLLSPLTAIQHVEGFSATIDSLALHLVQDGSLRPYDRVFPFNLEFFATSRAGAIAALSGLHAVAPGAGDGAFKLLVVVGLLLLAVGSMQVIRVWTGTGWLAAGAALVLMPGVFESSFIYNDNVLSSGLAATSLALLREGPRVYLGRLWTPLVWGAWHRSVARDFETVRNLAATPRDAVIVTTYWNSDRYLHRELQRDRFRLDMSLDAKATCGGTTETFRRGDQVIRHLRLHTPILSHWQWYMLPTQERFEATCGADVAGLPVFVLAESGTASNVSPVGVPRSPFAAHAVSWPWRPLTFTSMDLPALHAMVLREQQKNKPAGDVAVRWMNRRACCTRR